MVAEQGSHLSLLLSLLWTGACFPLWSSPIQVVSWYSGGKVWIRKYIRCAFCLRPSSLTLSAKSECLCLNRNMSSALYTPSPDLDQLNWRKKVRKCLLQPDPLAICHSKQCCRVVSRKWCRSQVHFTELIGRRTGYICYKIKFGTTNQNHYFY